MFEILFKIFGGTLSELQQLEDELENNIQKWHWAGHVQKTIILFYFQFAFTIL